MDNNPDNPYISICIPAYKRVAYLERLLNSIEKQDFRSFEVVLSDDSPDDSVKTLLSKFSNLPIQYYHNNPALGTPANWNFAIEKANSEWIKIMHDDDWFAGTTSLSEFAELTKTGRKVIFSGYKNVFPDGRTQKKWIPDVWYGRIKNSPLQLLSDNVIGPPSVMMIHRSVVIPYDIRLKWRVDIDYYVQLIQQLKEFAFTKKFLINVGISNSQVTNDCINQPDVELPEGNLLLLKYGVQSLKKIRVYDAWWRIFRNLEIKSRRTLDQYVPGGKWPEIVSRMILHQSKIPRFILSLGIFSKIFMTISYILNYQRIK